MRPLVAALHPSVDVERRVIAIRGEAKNEVLGERRGPGGTGVNVARWLTHLGASSRLLRPLGAGMVGRSGAGRQAPISLFHQSRFIP